MYTLDTIKFQPTRSKASDRVILSKTVINALNVIRTVRPEFTANDVQYIINNNVRKSEQVTVGQVEKEIKKIAADIAAGYKYIYLRGKISSIGYGFYK